MGPPTLSTLVFTVFVLANVSADSPASWLTPLMQYRAQYPWMAEQQDRRLEELIEIVPFERAGLPDFKQFVTRLKDFIRLGTEVLNTLTDDGSGQGLAGLFGRGLPALASLFSTAGGREAGSRFGGGQSDTFGFRRLTPLFINRPLGNPLLAIHREVESSNHGSGSGSGSDTRRGGFIPNSPLFAVREVGGSSENFGTFGAPVAAAVATY